MKGYRDACAWAFVASKPIGWKAGPVVLDIEYRVHRGIAGYKPKDEDNARSALKNAVDGGRDAGIFFSDSHRNVRYGKFGLITTQRDVERAGGPGVFVTVRRV